MQPRLKSLVIASCVKGPQAITINLFIRACVPMKGQRYRPAIRFSRISAMMENTGGSIEEALSLDYVCAWDGGGQSAGVGQLGTPLQSQNSKTNFNDPTLP